MRSVELCLSPVKILNDLVADTGLLNFDQRAFAASWDPKTCANFVRQFFTNDRIQ
jgi:hypothetical protein